METTTEVLKETPEFSVVEITEWSDEEYEFWCARTDKVVKRKSPKRKYLRVIHHGQTDQST